jgi:peptide/nickel transport system permease protein
MLQIPWLLSGVIVVEVFFAYQGFGTLLYQAALNSDIYLIEACTMVSVVVVVLTQIVSDFLYACLNPRMSMRRTLPAQAL